MQPRHKATPELDANGYCPNGTRLKAAIYGSLCVAALVVGLHFSEQEQPTPGPSEPVVETTDLP